MTSTAEPTTTDLLRRVNDSIWESLGPGGYRDPIAFFCECSETGCYQPVWLTAAEYEVLRDVPRLPLVSPLHGAQALVPQRVKRDLIA